MQLIARGRAADVYDAGPGLVLRRYRSSTQDAAGEAAAMAHLAAAGYPVPRVESAHGPDLLMERLDGPTMLRDLAQRPWTMRRHAATLAALHVRLGEIPAPPGLRTPLGPGTAMLHLDLHPDNVLLTDRGPVVIDWTNASAGPAPADVADTWLLVACASPERGRLVAALGQALLTRLFLRGAGREAAVEHLHAAYAHRVGDHNMRPVEVTRMRALVRRETGRDPAASAADG